MNQQPAAPEVEQVRRALLQALGDDGCDAAAAPIRAGMRARAVADVCERMDLAAIFVDATGRVLHVGAQAERYLGDRFRLSAGHLVGRSQQANRAVQRAINAALGAPDDQPAAKPSALVGIPYVDSSPYQMLRGVLVFAAEGTKLAALRTMLAA